MGIFGTREYYRPFSYPWAFEAYETQQKLHWLPGQAPMHKDVQDWELKLNPGERNLLTQLFRFFTQGDVDVAAAYRDKYSQWFKHPEISMFLWAAGASEANHVHAYSTLIDTIGLPEIEYKAFHEIKEMSEKHAFLFGQRGQDLSEVQQKILDIAVFSAFSEGMQLFSSFAILMSFQRRGLMNGMTTIVEWSIRDESHHVETMTKLYRAILEENPEAWTSKLKGHIYEVAKEMVTLEDNFIDLAFGMGDIQGITAAETKQFIRWVCDRRLNGLGLHAVYKVPANPLGWLSWIMNAQTHTNFFEQRSTEYGKASLSGWDKAYSSLPNEAQFIIFTKPGCDWCEMAARVLGRLGRGYKVICLSELSDREDFYNEHQVHSMPQVFVTYDEQRFEPATRIGGYDELVAWITSGSREIAQI